MKRSAFFAQLQFAGGVAGLLMVVLLSLHQTLAADGSAETVQPLPKSQHRVITEDDRQFWSFRPVADPAIPLVDDRGWCRNPIDNFVFAQLKAEGLSPAPEADRLTLIRRATYDLTGLPATPSEVDAFLKDAGSNAYEQLIDRLLASPRYGERYARHWLDLVRYAESDGFKQDAYRPNVWPYRDYVIRSFNDDKPYNRFVAEQLAGDEIAPNDPDVLVATAYLRHGQYEYNQRNIPQAWGEMLNDITDVTADAFLGVSLSCARCHDHKFDPILQTDYFRFQAFFAPMLPRNDLVVASAKQQADYEKLKGTWETETAALREEMSTIERPAALKAAAVAMKKFPPDMQALLEKPAAEQSPFERQMVQMASRQLADPDDDNAPLKMTGEDKKKYESLKKQLAAFEADRPPAPPKVPVVTDLGPASPPMHVPGHTEALDPGYPAVLDRASLKTPLIQGNSTTTGRRTALAEWITQPNNPVTTRVIANRLWQWHFGHGIVRTGSDFGRLGEPPTHPELLDWLTRRFVEGTSSNVAASSDLGANSAGWTMKQMHRLIMTSATYRQAALRTMPELAKMKDPENRWLWRFSTQRLEAEEVRDAMLAVSGELRLEIGGPSVTSSTPRRTIYTQVLRNKTDPLLEAFDEPESFGSVPNRNITTTSTQALLLINGEWTLQRATAMAARLRKDAVAPNEAGALVEPAYRLAYGRAPTENEREAAVKFLHTNDGDFDASLVDFCHALLNSNEFLYVD